jgi:AcrR family transcriptional regulator
MIYGVEVSRAMARKPKPKSRSPRGLDAETLLKAAFEQYATGGADGFSVRRLAAALGIDPMTVLHHFGTKEALLRRIADHALATLELPAPTGKPPADLRAVADAYRAFAHRYPKLFQLHFRYHATGPADHATSETVYRALLDMGHPAKSAAGLGLAFYAFVLGFALAEAEGLLKPPSAEEEDELSRLDDTAYPATRRLMPAFKTLDPDAAFEAAIGAFVTGLGPERTGAAVKRAV